MPQISNRNPKSKIGSKKKLDKKVFSGNYHRYRSALLKTCRTKGFPLRTKEMDALWVRRYGQMPNKDTTTDYQKYIWRQEGRAKRAKNLRSRSLVEDDKLPSTSSPR